MVAKDDEIQGMVGVKDTVREDSQSVIDNLNTLGVRTVMLTGDNAAVAEVVGKKVGVKLVFTVLARRRADLTVGCDLRRCGNACHRDAKRNTPATLRVTKESPLHMGRGLRRSTPSPPPS
jgi:magnesium-transporting ATPase (P-type)